MSREARAEFAARFKSRMSRSIAMQTLQQSYFTTVDVSLLFYTFCYTD